MPLSDQGVQEFTPQPLALSHALIMACFGALGRRWNRGVWVLLVDQVLMNAGFFMLFPLLTVHLTRDLGFDATGVGLVLGARNLLQQGAAPFGGSLADRIGYKPVIVAGFLVRAVGFVLFAMSGSVLGVVAGAAVTAVGGALFDPPSRASLAYLTPERDRQSAYAAAGTAGWIGQIIGPLIGAVLLPVSFELVSIVSASAFLLAGIQAAIFLPGGMRGDPGGRTMLGSIGSALRDREFAWFTALMLGFYFLASQPTITVPLLAARLIGPESIGPLFAVQAVVAMAVQVPLVRWAAKRMPPLIQVSLAMLLMGCGFVAYALASDFLLLVVGTALMAVGMVLVIPVHSTVTARLAGSQGGAYFGVGALALAFGGAFGNGSGGLLVDLGDRSGLAWLPWVGMFGVAVLSAAGFGWLNLDRRFRARLASGMRPAVKPKSHASSPEPPHAPGRAEADARDEADAHLDLPRSAGDLRRPGRPA